MMNSEAIKPTVYFLSFVGSRYSRSGTILNSKSESVNRKYLQLDSGVKGITQSILKKRLELREADAIVVMSPCQMIAPYFEELANKNKNITFIKVDVDEAEDIAADCNIAGIRSNVTIKHSI